MNLLCSKIIVLVLPLMMAVTAFAQDLDSFDSAYKARINQFRRFTAHYSFEITVIPEEEMMALNGEVLNGRTLAVIEGNVVGNGKFSRDGQSWWYQYDVEKQEGSESPLPGSFVVKAQSYDRFETYRIPENTPDRPIGSISNPTTLPDERIDVSFGLRLLKDPEFWDQTSFTKAISSGEWISKSKLAITNAHLHKTILEFSPFEQYTLVGYEVRSADGELVIRGDFTDLRKIGDVKVPHLIQWQRFNRDGTLYQQELYTITSLTFTPLKTYQIEWPLNSRIADHRTGATIGVQSRPQVLTDELLHKAGREYAAKYPHLSPNLDSIAESKGSRDYIWTVLLWANVLFLACLFGYFFYPKKDEKVVTSDDTPKPPIL